MADEATAPRSQEISFDDMGAQLEALEKANSVKLEDVKIDGDDVPERVRGKSARELINYTKGVEDALRASEAARQEALILAQTAAAAGNRPAAEAVPQAPAEPELTRDQIKELYETDPLAAIEAMQKQALMQAERHLQQRLDPLISGAGSAAEAAVRAKFPEEFEVLGAEIKQMADSMPDKRMLSQPGNWEQLVTFVKGQHFDKLYEHRQQKAGRSAVTTAQQEQIANTGFHGQPDQRSNAPVITAPSGKKVIWDDYAAEIASKMGMTKEDYILWST